MKLTHLIPLTAIIPMLASCSLIQSTQKSKTVSGAEGTATTPATNTPAPTPTAPGATSPASTASTAESKATPSATSERNLSGEWLIVQAGSTIIDRDEDMPYIIFEPQTGRFYGSNGCNVLNGSYVLNPDDTFTFAHIATTMRYCPDVDFQHQINIIFADGVTTKARFSEIGTESYIDFLSDSGKEVLKLRRANLDFLNGHWSVETINGAPADQAPADIFFDIAERKIHGNTGCNYFNGEIYLDHRHPNAIDFSKMGLTRMACPFSQQETAMMVALEQTASAITGGKDAVMLLDSEGRELITLRRLDDATAPQD